MPHISMVFLADSFGDNQDLCSIRCPSVAANNTPAPSILFLSNLNKKKIQFLGLILQVDILVVWADLWCIRCDGKVSYHAS